MDVKYKLENLDEIVRQADNLNPTEKPSLRVLLNKYEELFDGTLGDFNTPPIKLEKKAGAEPVHSKPFPVPHIHRDTLKKKDQTYGSVRNSKKIVMFTVGKPYIYYTKAQWHGTNGI